MFSLSELYVRPPEDLNTCQGDSSIKVTRGQEFNCSLHANSFSEYKLNIADRIFAVLPLLVSELLTFNVNCLLDDDSYEFGEILGVILESSYDETVLPSLPNVFIQTAL